MKFELEYCRSIDEIRKKIKDCEQSRHVQQVAYSTYEDSFTQICFGCKKIRTNLLLAIQCSKEENKNEQ